MTHPNADPTVADEVPWSGSITEYDNQHDETYLRLLDSDNNGVSKDEMARTILDIDPASEPERARKSLDSHLKRARWMSKVGYRLLLAGQYPGAERDRAEQIELLQLLGITVDPPDGRAGR